MEGFSNPSEEVNYENSDYTNNHSDKGIDLNSKEKDQSDSNSATVHQGRWT